MLSSQHHVLLQKLLGEQYKVLLSLEKGNPQEVQMILQEQSRAGRSMLEKHQSEMQALDTQSRQIRAGMQYEQHRLAMTSATLDFLG